MEELQSFEQVVKAFEPLIKKTIRYAGLQKDYEDAFQMGMIALWEAYKSFDPLKGYFPAHAKALVYGKLLTYKRKEKTYNERYSLNSSELETDNIAPPPAWQLSLELDQFGLSERERCWLLSVFEAGLSTKEISQTYNVSENTVRTWKKGAVRKLKKQGREKVYLEQK
ncbi:sigma-70 family RNA polymerase sigma factor [Pullulanibacillus sp. KACC 23026]|uniref:sigma-70 family RNA polymerase sigma factor n=1 Tax=Pullulanibacillus sp. KACC 23026 TaxID=3028315 RepID=UPI0023B1C34E|nr:sigma-70 family RNA polymerase sigma factor [Pullulanibacillus sp. KACC 23026]WEG13431.1 sigma-70 family RNA polymerase sigma factor [Pullulanibacillus sp. KACC 23026]